MSESLCKTIDLKTEQKILATGRTTVLTQDTIVVYDGQYPNTAIWMKSGRAIFIKSKKSKKKVIVKLPVDVSDRSLNIKIAPVLLFVDQVLHQKSAKVTVVLTKGSEIIILDKPTLIHFSDQNS
jgi:hypothetical protein